MQEIVLRGTVMGGKRLGRTIGFPTANMDVGGRPGCRPGVYYGTCEADGQVWRVILNIGSHPTAPEGPPTIEAHLIGYEGDLYGREIEVVLKRFMREETKFPSIGALKEQLQRDMEQAMGWPV